MSGDRGSSDDDGEIAVAGRDGSVIQSVEIGMSVLTAVARQSGPSSLAAVAKACGMARTKTFRYLNSLERTQHVEREPGTGRYRLGGASVQLGLAALAGVDFARIGSEWLPAICRDLDETVFLTLWGQHGATIVRWEETGRPVAVNVRVGSTMPLIRSATGQLFGAFMPETALQDVLEAELAAGEGGVAGVADAAGAREIFARVREAGIARAHGHLLPSLGAVAVPVFEAGDRLAGVLTSLGLLGVFDDRIDGTTAHVLSAWAERLSIRLGAQRAERDASSQKAAAETVERGPPRGFASSQTSKAPPNDTEKRARKRSGGPKAAASAAPRERQAG